MPTYRGGRHEHGQNFLTDRETIASIVDLVARTDGPIIEIGPGGGALTAPMARLNRSITAIEIDPRLAQRLSRNLPSVNVINQDFLTYQLPDSPTTVVGNLPFHLTTAILRKLLHARRWQEAVLVMQWEVARRRAGIGAMTMMTAQWAPWYEFGSAQRISAAAFTPQPSVDAGLLTIRRRYAPLIPMSERSSYQSFVHSVFTGRGRGLAEILSRASPTTLPESRSLLSEFGFHHSSLPRDLTVEAWVGAFKRFGIR